MKLATYLDGSRDGQLVVVSRDLSIAHYASGIATRLQQVLDDWNFLSPQLQELSQTLNHGKARHAFAFEPRQCMAPLPRAYQHVVSAAYAAHAAPLQQRASDDLHGACADIAGASVGHGIDFGGALAVVTGDVDAGTSPTEAIESVRLLMLANDAVLHDPAHGPDPTPLATSFSPVAATPDELGAAWQGGRVHLHLECAWNGKRIGLLDAGPEMALHFGELIAHLCRTRAVRAGSIVGSGAVRNAERSRGAACIADKRAQEAADSGAPKTGFMQAGDSVLIDMKGSDGHSMFGAIEQAVRAAAP